MNETTIHAELPTDTEEFCVIYRAVGKMGIIGGTGPYERLALAKKFVTDWESEFGPIELGSTIGHAQ